MIITLVLFLIIALVWAIYFTTVMPGRSYHKPSPGLDPAQQVMHDNLQTHINVLADKIAERNMQNYAKLLLAAEYIEQQFINYKYKVSSQAFNVMGKPVRNIIAELPGTSHANEIIIIGAHYDSVTGSPGANDNGSGVAAMLEIASQLRSQALARTVRFIGFVNEEPPYSYTLDMGSNIAAKQSKEKNENIIAMLSLETIGYYSDQVKSQQYPTLLNLFYPNTGNFIAFVSNLKSRSLLRRSIKSFRQHAEIPSEGLAAPNFMPEINLSDHWSYWNQGYQALMITDTAMFRYPYYHSSQDTKDKVDYVKLTKVTLGLQELIKDLADQSH